MAGLGAAAVGQSFSSTYNKVNSNVGSLVHSGFQFLVDGGEMIGEGIGSSAELVLGEGAELVAGISGREDIRSWANDCLNESQTLFNDAEKNMINCINDAKTIGSDVISDYASVAGFLIGMVDKKLGDDFDGLVNRVADFAANLAGDAVEQMAIETAGVYRLTKNATAVLSSLVAAGLAAGSGHEDMAKDLGGDSVALMKRLGNGIASSLLSTVTFIVSEVKEVIVEGKVVSK